MTTLFGILLLALLLALAAVDLRQFRLPDPLTALLAVIGLAQALSLGEPTVPSALAGAGLAGLLTFGTLVGYRRARGRDGLGLGDVKLAAAGGLWVGVELIGPMILIAAASAAAVVGLHVVRGGAWSRDDALPFGPFVALGIMAAWLIPRVVT